jgi:helix-turn-helix protein
MALYHKNKADRKLSEHEREALVQYYKDYKAVNGNSYIDKYYARMEKWQTIPEEYDEE